MSDLSTALWPITRLGEAMDLLVQRTRIARRAELPPVAPQSLSKTRDGRVIDPWIHGAASWLGVDAEPEDVPYAQTENYLKRSSPSMIQVQAKEMQMFLVIVRRRGRLLEVLCPDLGIRPVSVAEARAFLCQECEDLFSEGLDKTLTAAGVPDKLRARAKKALFIEALAGVQVGRCWMLRVPPSAGVWNQVRDSGLHVYFAGLMVVQVFSSMLGILTWWLAGSWALDGHFDPALFIAWTLALFTSIPLGLVGGYLENLMSVGAGGLMKRRMFLGGLRLDPEEIRHLGVGQLLGRVDESEAVESLFLSGGFTALTIVTQLGTTVWVLLQGAGGPAEFGIFAACMLAATALGWKYYVARRNWTVGELSRNPSHGGSRFSRLGMTHDLIEAMVGHRTRLVQQVPERWHEGEDRALESYHETSRIMDWTGVSLYNAIPAIWLLAGLIALIPALALADLSAGKTAVSLAGVLMAGGTLGAWIGGLTSLVDLKIAWSQAGTFYNAAGRVEELSSASVKPTPVGEALVEAHDLVFRYAGRSEAIINGCDLTIRAGDKIILEGPSGGGKSTFASMLTGLRVQESGLLLFHGLDRQTLGSEAWRKRAVFAPQYHENHVLTETFAFNLLMGRRWPPRMEDMAEAEEICAELDLGHLLRRMPSGMIQRIGESGWQLSNGEKSRLYLARALLQGADIVILDESFAALDPETYGKAVRCAVKRAPTLLIIAHP